MNLSSADLAFAFSLADTADRVSTEHFRSEALRTTTNGDGTPVSQVDLAVEQVMLDRVHAERPGDAVLGEEIGAHAGTSGRRWIFDGIDGTHNYAAGHPAWATMIALEVDGEVTVGMVSSPVAGIRWYAERGGGAWCLRGPNTEPERLTCGTAEKMDDGIVLAVPGAGFMLGWRSDLAGALVRGNPSHFGTYAYYGAAVAEGSLDATVILAGGPWDFAANIVIVQEAGGDYHDIWGGKRLDTFTIAFTNGHVTDELLALSAPFLPTEPDEPQRNPNWRPVPGLLTP